MKQWLPLVLLMLSATTLSVRAATPADTLTIYTKFAQAPSAKSIEFMKAELGAIMFPVNLQFAWRSLAQASGHEVVAEVMVVTFQGACRADVPPPARDVHGALGETHIVDGHVLPFADVDCDKIRDLMSPTMSISQPLDREAMLGRAMARVLAHEIYHFLAHTRRHAATGIAKPFFTKRDLMADRLLFDEHDLAFLRNRLPRRLPNEDLSISDSGTR